MGSAARFLHKAFRTASLHRVEPRVPPERPTEASACTPPGGREEVSRGSTRCSDAVTHAAIVVVLLAAGLAIFWPLKSVSVNPYDEGLTATGADRILHGQVPYRDFWYNYSPGQVYLVAALFRLFGPSMMVVRAWDLTARVLLALVLFALAAGLGHRRAAWLVWLVSALCLLKLSLTSYPIYPALLFCLVSLYLTLRVLRGGSGLFWAGFCLGVAGLFRHDFLPYGVLAQAPLLLLRSASAAGPLRWSRLLRCVPALWPYFAGVLLLPVLVLLALLKAVPPGALWTQLVYFPLKIYPYVRSSPLPPLSFSLDSLPFYAPPLVLGLCAIVTVARFRAGQRSVEEIWGPALLLLFGALCMNHLRVRSDFFHAGPQLLSCLPLLPLLLAGLRSGSRPGPRLLAIGTLALCAALCVRPVQYYARLREIAADPDFAKIMAKMPPRGRGTVTDGDHLWALLGIRQLTAPGEPIFVGLWRHDRIEANNALFYFLAERPCPTRYHELQPGIADTPAVQEEIVRDLKRSAIRYAVLVDPQQSKAEPSGTPTGTPAGADALDRYLHEQFTPMGGVGKYLILARKPIAK